MVETVGVCAVVGGCESNNLGEALQARTVAHAAQLLCSDAKFWVERGGWPVMGFGEFAARPLEG